MGSAGGGMVGRPSVWSVFGALGLLVLAGSAVAQQPPPARLTAEGVMLSRIPVTVTSAVVERQVQLDAGEAVTGTYVSLRTNDGRYLQRNNDGYWLPWSGRENTLADNRFQPVGNLLTFKVLKQDISDQSFPLTVSIAYRTAAGVKFGMFEVMPQ
jgi:hypothetical protein